MIIQSLDELKSIDFQAGVTLLVDKPLNWTSFDVVNKIRFLLRKRLDVKKIKVGHSGTLDPLATGLLIIAVGRDTKKIEEYLGLNKKYTGTIKLGGTTASYDAEFEPDQFYKTDHITPEMLEETRKKFVGLISQVPPSYSAVKVDGERAYKLARSGKEPVLKSRQVEIIDFRLDDANFPELNFEVHCQKGTYIRSLAHDFGKALGSGAYLSSLRRTSIGPYRIGQAFQLDTLVKQLM